MVDLPRLVRLLGSLWSLTGTYIFRSFSLMFGGILMLASLVGVLSKKSHLTQNNIKSSR